MADINSDVVANIVATPAVKNPVQLVGGRTRSKVGEVELGGSQANNDVLRFFRVKSGDRVGSLALSNDALTGATDVNFGLHDAGAGGAVVDDNLFDDAQTLASALVRQEKRVGTNSALNIDTLNLRVWQLLGLSSDPAVEYDVTATLIAAGSASGTVVLEMEYSAGD
jgi:hypothetical protein